MAKEIVAFDPESARLIAQQTLRSLRNPRKDRLPQRTLDPVEFNIENKWPIYVKNTSGETAPAFGIGKLGPQVFELVDHLIPGTGNGGTGEASLKVDPTAFNIAFELTKPDGLPGIYVAIGPNFIEDDGFGFVGRHGILPAKFNESTSDTPGGVGSNPWTTIQSWGPVDGSWLLESSYGLSNIITNSQGWWSVGSDYYFHIQFVDRTYGFIKGRVTVNASAGGAVDIDTVTPLAFSACPVADDTDTVNVEELVQNYTAGETLLAVWDNAEGRWIDFSGAVVSGTGTSGGAVGTAEEVLRMIFGNPQATVDADDATFTLTNTEAVAGGLAPNPTETIASPRRDYTTTDEVYAVRRGAVWYDIGVHEQTFTLINGIIDSPATVNVGESFNITRASIDLLAGTKEPAGDPVTVFLANNDYTAGDKILAIWNEDNNRWEDITPGAALPDHPIIKIRNSTATTFFPGRIVNYTSPEDNNPPADGAGLLQPVLEYFYGGAPQRHERFAVVIRTALPNEYAQCAVTGHAAVRLFVTDSTHKFAVPNADVVSLTTAGELRENDYGVEIVWKQDPQGTGTMWAIVDLTRVFPLHTHATIYMTQSLGAGNPLESGENRYGVSADAYVIARNGIELPTPEEIDIYWESPDAVPISATGKARLVRARWENNRWVAYGISCNEFTWSPP